MQPNQRKTFYQRWSWPLLLLTLVATPYSFYTAIRAVRSNQNHVEDWLPKAFDETQKLAWFRKHFASDQFVIVSWEGCQLGLGEGEQDDPRLQILTAMLKGSDTLDPTAGSTNSETNTAEAGVETPPVLLEPKYQVSAHDRELIEKYVKTVESGRTVLNKLTAEPLSLTVKEAIKRLKGVMIGPDGKQTCLIVTLKPAALKELKSVVGNGRKRLVGSDIEPGLLTRLIRQVGLSNDEVHLGGPPVDNTAIDEEGERTLIRLAGVSGLLGIGLAWWSLRNVALTAIVFLCGVLSAASSLGVVWLTGQNVDAILMSMPSLVYVLAISGAIHLVSYYREAVETSGMYGACERAVKLAWRPALLCSITTAIGLLSLAVSELVPIKKFGIYSAIGVMVLLVIVYLVVPAALQISGAGKRWLKTKRPVHDDKPTAHDNDFVGSFWYRYASFTIRHYKFVGFCSILFTAFVSCGLYYAKSSIDLLKLFDSRARILQDYRWLEAHLGKLVPLEIVLVFPDHWQARLDEEPSGSLTAPLTFVQRMEIVSQLQAMIEQRFGANSGDIVGQSLSAAAFAPKLPSEKSGMKAIVYRTTINKRLTADKSSLVDTGFLRIDDQDNSELWRISLRVAAFNDVDYGTFTRDLQAVAQPLIDACYLRSKVLSELQARTIDANNNERQKVLLWGYFNEDPSRPQKEQVIQLLSNQLQQLAIDVVVEKRAPAEVPISGLNRLKDYDSIIAYGDFNDNDMRLTRSVMPKLMIAKASEMPTSPRPSTNNGKDGNSTGSQAVELSAIYTGVVPIVYQAQRALLNSLSESTFWSFLTITPIMMFVSRSVLAGCVAMIPNLVPILLVFGGMGWMGVAIDIGSLMTASIALGVAVDDTIHFLARFREELDHRHDRHESIAAAYCHCAVPTLQAATISGLGLSVFAFSTFAPTQKFGWLMLSILFAGVVAELVLLPALLASPLGKCFISQKKAPEAAPESSQMAA